MEERGEAEGLGRLHIGKVAALALGKADGEHRRRPLDVVRYALGRQRGRNHAGQAVRVGLQALVERFIGQLQRLQAGGHGHRITGQRAGLVDRTVRGEVVHNLGAAAEGSGRQATGDDLAEGHQVRRHAVDAVPALIGGAEAGHDLVEDEEGAVSMGDVGKRGVEAFLWCHGAHVAGRGFRDNAGNLARVLRKCLAHGLDIVIRNDDGIGRCRARNTRGIRQRKGRHAGTGRGQQGVHVAVVATLELQHLGAAGVAAGQAHRRHGGLGAGVDHAHLIGRGARDDGFREQSLTLGGRAKAQAARSGLLHGLHNLWVRIAVNHRAIGADQVNVLVAVDVPQARARTALNHAGLAAHGAKRAHRRVHPARNHLGGTLKPLLRLGSIRHV